MPSKTTILTKLRAATRIERELFRSLESARHARSYANRELAQLERNPHRMSISIAGVDSKAWFTNERAKAEQDVSDYEQRLKQVQSEIAWLKREAGLTETITETTHA